MEAMNAVQAGQSARLEEAFATLSLDEIPLEERDSRKIELVKNLFDILNSFTFSIDAVPDEPTGKSYQLPVGKDRQIEIILTPDKEGLWFFNYPRTLRHLGSYIDRLKAAQEKQAQDTTVDPVLRSPRDTMSLFLGAMNRQRGRGPDDARDCLDLTRVESAVRQEIARERIAMLKYVLDRHKFIDLVEIPNDPAGPPFIFMRHASGNVIIERVRLPDSSIEAWKFSARTVDELPALYDAFRGKPLAEGVQGATEIPLSVRVRDYMHANFPSLLDQTFVLENWQWLGIFCVIFLGLGISRLLVSLLVRFLRVFFSREDLQLDKGVESRFVLPIGYALMAWIWWLGLSALGLPANVRLLLLVSVKVFTALAGVWGAYRLMDVIGDYLAAKAARTPNKFDDLLVPLVTRGLKVLTIAFGLVFLSDIFALDIDKLLAGLGLGAWRSRWPPRTRSPTSSVR
jgi:MscS family membrane protein